MNRSTKQSMNAFDNGSFQKFCTRQNIDKAVHTLEGFLKGISIDDEISDLEVSELKNWVDQYFDYMKVPPLCELLPIVKGICEYKKISDDDKEDLLWVCQNLKESSDFYNVITSDMQVLHGMLHGILADGRITKLELENLQQWLYANEHLQGSYPYDEISALILGVLEDNVVSKEEEDFLKVYFGQFANIDLKMSEDEIANIKSIMTKQGICAVDPVINIQNSLFSFTGKSTHGTRKDIANVITTNGGDFNDRVIEKTNYLIVGNDGNPCWAFACYGRKVEKAIKLRQEGSHILIINELDFWDAVS